MHMYIYIHRLDKDELLQVEGCPTSFYCGILIPNDGILHSSKYATALLQTAVQMNPQSNSVRIYEHCPKVTTIVDGSGSDSGSDSGSESEEKDAVVILANKHVITTKYVVVATGGLMQHSVLNGVLKPEWSYLVGLPPHTDYIPPKPRLIPGTQEEGLSSSMTRYSYNSHNFFTWGFTHDWCWVNGAVRVSGWYYCWYTVGVYDILIDADYCQYLTHLYGIYRRRSL